MEKKDKTLNVPHLRFPEFSGEWEKATLQSVATLSKGTGISKDQLSEEGQPCILYGELYTKYNSEIIDTIISKTDIDPEKLVRSQANDVIIPCSGESAVDIATARCVKQSKVLLGGDLNIIRLKGEHDGSFFAYQLNGKRKYDIAKVAQGVSVVHLYGEHLKRVMVNYPSATEQKKISSLLALIDQRIETQKKIIEDLKKLKSAIGNKLLHACFCNSNCTIQLSSVLNERKEYNENDGTYPHGSLSKEGVTLKSERYDRDFLVKDEDKKYKVSHYNDICYNPANLKFGVISRNKLGSIIFSPIYVTYEINDKYNSEYIELLVTNYEFIGRVRKFEQGTVYERMAVSSEDFLSYKISFPSKKTQDKIADNIRAIDTKLQNELNILDYTEKQKNYLLSQLFI